MSAAELVVEVAYGTRRPWVPAAQRVAEWARAAAGREGRGGELAVRIVGPREGRRLNRDYRGKDAATNVLSFPGERRDSRLSAAAGVRGARRAVTAATPGTAGATFPLGDLAICASVVAREARAQGKTLRAHWAHMVVHGVLHLLGLDHERSAAEARRMEGRERTILARLGYADPYEVT